MILYIVISAMAALVTVFASFIVYFLAIKYRIAQPVRNRDVHTVPVPRLGGIAMYLGFLLAVFLASKIHFFDLVFAKPNQIIAILISVTIIVLVGFLDDIFDLDWFVKLAAQLISAIILVTQGIQIASFPFGSGLVVASPIINFIVSVFVIVLVMNAINFIDGLDGLVAGVAILANGAFFLYTYILAFQSNQSTYFSLAGLLSIIIVGTCFGFLPYNWHRAKMFMGDTGALMVGLLMAIAAISVTGQLNPSTVEDATMLAAYIPILMPAAVIILPIIDFCLAVIRRLSAGKSPFSADRKHLHHRLLDMGHSHFNAVLIFYAWTATVSFGFLIIFATKGAWYSYVLLAVFAIACVVMTVIPFDASKKLEKQVQLSSVDSASADVMAPYDPLDSASESRIILDDRG